MAIFDFKRIALAVCLCLVAGAAQAKTLSGCDAFVEKLRKAAPEMHIEFSHAVVVSRARLEESVFDIATSVGVDATLTCRGDDMARYEARLLEPATKAAAVSFEQFQSISLVAALGWDAGKARNVLRGMNADVREYLAASKERGDLYIAGKTEEHEAGGVSLGLIQTDADRAFIIVGSGG